MTTPRPFAALLLFLLLALRTLAPALPCDDGTCHVRGHDEPCHAELAGLADTGPAFAADSACCDDTQPTRYCCLARGSHGALPAATVVDKGLAASALVSRCHWKMDLPAPPRPVAVRWHWQDGGPANPPGNTRPEMTCRWLI